jgi:hypothetical protein
MADNPRAAEPAQRLPGRIDALSVLSRCLLSTMVVRGLLTREEALTMLEKAGASLQGSKGKKAARDELAAIGADLHARIRMAAHPRVSGHHDDH